MSLVENLAPGILVLSGVGLVLGLLMWLWARRNLSWAQYPIEKENAHSLGGIGITLLVVSAQMILLIWLILTVLNGAWENLLAENTPDNPQTVSLSDFAEDGEAVVRGPATSAFPDPEGCLVSQANITSPSNGTLITEEMPIMGTAALDSFSHFRFEIKAADAEFFGVIGGATSDFTEPVLENQLTTLDPLDYMPGEYRYRLVVFDQQNVDRASCEITVFLSEMPATPILDATPLVEATEEEN